MLAVKGIYDSGMVQFSHAQAPVKGQYEVIVTFLTPKQEGKKKDVSWLKESWKIDDFKPLSREELYDRT